MKTTYRTGILLGMCAALGAGAGCSSSSSDTDGGDAVVATQDSAVDSASDAATLYGLTCPLKSFILLAPQRSGQRATK